MKIKQALNKIKQIFQNLRKVFALLSMWVEKNICFIYASLKYNGSILNSPVKIDEIPTLSSPILGSMMQKEIVAKINHF